MLKNLLNWTYVDSNMYTQQRLKSAAQLYNLSFFCLQLSEHATF